MGVGSKAEADARLAALKAEMRGEVGVGQGGLTDRALG
jgi:hypothetical protein